jgi:hypothetical protein
MRPSLGGPRQGLSGEFSANGNLDPENCSVQKNSTLNCRNFQMWFGYFCRLLALLINFLMSMNLGNHVGTAG